MVRCVSLISNMSGTSIDPVVRTDLGLVQFLFAFCYQRTVFMQLPRTYLMQQAIFGLMNEWSFGKESIACTDLQHTHCSKWK